MGPKQSTEEQNEKLKINHPKFRKAELMKDNDVLRTFVPIQNEAHFEEWSNKLNKISHLDDEVLLLPRSYRYVRRAICGSSGELNIDFDKYNFILDEQLKNRRNMRKFFDEGELWYLLFSLVNAAHDFKKINSKIGDVRPPNIFINQQGQVKIANMFSWPNEPSNYIKTLDDNEKTYLAPEEMENIKNGDSDNYIDKYRAESFSIGMTLLEAGLMRDMAPLYNSYTRDFDDGRLSVHLKDWWSLIFQHVDSSSKTEKPSRYSDSLKMTIAAMSELNMNDRLTSQQVYQWLKPSSEEINNLKEFKKDLPPVKNKEKYRLYMHGTNQPISNKIGTNTQELQTGKEPYQSFFHKYSTLTGHPNDDYSKSNTIPNRATVNTGYKPAYNPTIQQPPKFSNSYHPPSITPNSFNNTYGTRVHNNNNISGIQNIKTGINETKNPLGYNSYNFSSTNNYPNNFGNTNYSNMGTPVYNPTPQYQNINNWSDKYGGSTTNNVIK